MEPQTFELDLLISRISSSDKHLNSILFQLHIELQQTFEIVSYLRLYYSRRIPPLSRGRSSNERISSPILLYANKHIYFR